MKPYYQDEQCVLYLADAIALLPELGIVDLILTDPPYGIGYNSRHNSSWVQRGNAWCRKDAYGRPHNSPGIIGDDKPFDPSPWLPICKCAFFGGNYCADTLPPSPSWIIWDKCCGKTRSHQADCELCWTNFGKPARTINRNQPQSTAINRRCSYAHVPGSLGDQ